MSVACFVDECAKLRSLRAFVPYVSHVPTCIMCLRALRAHVSYVPACLRAFASHVTYFFKTCLTYLPFLRAFIASRALRAFIFMRALCAFIFLRVLHAIIFLRAFIFYVLSIYLCIC